MAEARSDMTATYSKDTVFISGNFNVLLLSISDFCFRTVSKRLIVRLLAMIVRFDAYIEESLRVEAVRTNSWVSKRS